MHSCQSREVVPQYIPWLNNTSCVVIYQNMIIILIPNFVPSFLWWYLCSILWSSTNNLTIQAVETTFTVSTWSFDILDHTGNIPRGFKLSLHQLVKLGDSNIRILPLHLGDFQLSLSIFQLNVGGIIGSFKLNPWFSRLRLDCVQFRAYFVFLILCALVTFKNRMSII